MKEEAETSGVTCSRSTVAGGAGSPLFVTTSNSLAAYCYPLISRLLMDGEEGDEQQQGGDRPLCPFLVVFNARKHVRQPASMMPYPSSFACGRPSAAPA